MQSHGIIPLMEFHDMPVNAKIMNLAVTRFDYRNKSLNLPSISCLLTAESIKRDRNGWTLTFKQIYYGLQNYWQLRSMRNMYGWVPFRRYFRGRYLQDRSWSLCRLRYLRRCLANGRYRSWVINRITHFQSEIQRIFLKGPNIIQGPAALQPGPYFILP